MTSTEHIRLIEPARDLESEFLRMLAEHKSAGEDMFNSDLAENDFPKFIRMLEQQSLPDETDPRFVPTNTYFLARNGGRILGLSRLRRRLTPALEEFGGHIGYVIRPSERRRGYGKLILELTLREADALGIQRVRLTCETDNIGSARIIESNGGILSGHGVSPENGKRTSQYWIDLSGLA